MAEDSCGVRISRSRSPGGYVVARAASVILVAGLAATLALQEPGDPAVR
ncbi:MAG TPA: hypothetical protein VMS12_01830 [Thermoanaerobaculia bacterium]|nr:hypothetical protein [Thermoanaerobaculia bacterium]